MTNVNERIRLFKIVREIPYYAAVGEEQDYSCSTKGEILQRLLRLQSRYRICEFRWEDLKLPQEILKYYQEDPEYHQFLEIQIPETKKWIIVDPTWDSGLKKILPVNDWDGIHDTEIAVPTKKIYSPTESEELIKRFNRQNYVEAYIRKNKEFLIALNKYFRRLRSN